MDPISIASNAATVAQIALKAYEFIKNAKNIDSTVHQIQSDLKQTSDVCDLVKIQVKLLPSSHHDLLKAIDSQINYCLIPIQEIEKKIVSQRRSSNFFSQAFRQAKFEINADDISKCKSQIQSSLTNLQLTLQLINIQATYLAPQRADDALLSMLDGIRQTLDKQGNKIGSELQHCAGQYLSSASTLYAESTRGTSNLGLQDNPKPNAVQGWLDQLKSIKINEPRTESLTDNDPASTPEHAASTADTSLLADGYESEDSLENEVANHALILGKEAFLAEEIDKAEKLLSEYLECIKIVQEHKRRMHELEEVHLLLAICAFHLHDAKNAELALVTAIGTETRSTKNEETKCDAVQSLAIIYMRTGRSDLAISTCERLYKGQKRLFGKDERCYKTLALLARIHAARGNTARTSAYRSMIPAESRERLLKDAEEISLQQIPDHIAPSDTDDNHDLNPLPFGNRVFECPTLACVAWSCDNKFMALGSECQSGKPAFWTTAIDVHDMANGRLLETFKFDKYYAFGTIAFSNSATKPAAGVRRMQPLEGKLYSSEVGLWFHVWSIMPKQLLWNVQVTYNKDCMSQIMLSFNPVNDDQLLAAYTCDTSRCKTCGFSVGEVAVYDLVHGLRTYCEKLPIRANIPSWSKAGPLVRGSGGNVIIDMAKHEMKLDVINDIEWRNMESRSYVSVSRNDLLVVSADGKTSHFVNGHGKALPMESCPTEAVRDLWRAKMTYGEHEKVLVQSRH